MLFVIACVVRAACSVYLLLTCAISVSQCLPSVSLGLYFVDTLLSVLGVSSDQLRLRVVVNTISISRVLKWKTPTLHISL